MTNPVSPADVMSLRIVNIDGHIWLQCTIDGCPWQERFMLYDDSCTRGNGQIVEHGMYHVCNTEGHFGS